MSEDKKNEGKAPKAVKEKESPEKHPAPKPVSDKVHHLKISHMGIQDLEHAIELTRQKMGGLHSKYAQFLVARRDYLKTQTLQIKKAA